VTRAQHVATTSARLRDAVAASRRSCCSASGTAARAYAVDIIGIVRATFWLDAAPASTQQQYLGEPDTEMEAARADWKVHLRHQLLRQRGVGGAVQNCDVQQLGHRQHAAARQSRATARPLLSTLGAAQQTITFEHIQQD
jgi:hypothetical protein